MYLQTNRMKAPPDDSIYALIEIFGICGTFLLVCWRWIDQSFKSKRDNNQDFIKSVVVATMESCLKDVNEKINKLFEYREADRNHIDEKFQSMVKEIRK